MPYKRDHQRMIGFIRLIGEMYNYTILSSTLVFDMFYMLLHYGHVSKSNLTVSAALSEDGGHPTASMTPAVSIFALPQFANMKIPTPILQESSSSTANVETQAAETNSASDAAKRKLLTSTLLQSRFDPSNYDPRTPSEMDPPFDLFRAQLVVELANTCGEYFSTGANKEKFSRFLVYFQRYLLCKQAVPMHIEFAILDMFDQLEEYAKEGM